MNAINVGVGWALPLTAKHNRIDIIDRPVYNRDYLRNRDIHLFLLGPDPDST